MGLNRTIAAAVLLAAAGLAAQAYAKDCIEVVTAGGGHAFWDAVGAGAHKAGQELGVDIYFRGPANEADTNAQSLILSKIHELKCKALVLAPNSPERDGDAEALRAEGIPTIYIDRDTAGSKADAVIATNNYRAGQFAAAEMAKALHGHGRVVVLRMSKEVVSTSERERGFLDGAAQAGLTVVDAGYVGTTIGETRIRTQQALQPLQGRFDGLFTPNESTTLGAMLTLQRMGLSGQVIHIGFDTGKQLAEALRANKLYGLVAQQPFQMGYQGVRLAYRRMHGEPIVSKHVDLDIAFITRANMNDPKIAPLLGD
jgi:ribose transport system substrate-binding protein